MASSSTYGNDIGTDLNIIHEDGEASLTIGTKNLRGLTKGVVLIVPSNYTTVGDEPDTVITDPNLPDSIANNSRYVLTNPFGITTMVMVQHEVLRNGVWARTGYYANTTNATFGTGSSYVVNEGLVLRTGSSSVMTSGVNDGSAHITGGVTSAPCRVWVFPQKLTGGNS